MPSDGTNLPPLELDVDQLYDLYAERIRRERRGFYGPASNHYPDDAFPMMWRPAQRERFEARIHTLRNEPDRLRTLIQTLKRCA